MTFSLISVFMLLVFWRPQEWLVPWLFGWPILDAIFYLALLGMLVEADTGKVRWPHGRPQLFLLGGLWFATLMSHVANTYFVGLVETFPETFKVCFFTTVLFATLDRPSRFRHVALLFVGMAAVMAIHALLQEKRGYGFAGQPPMSVWNVKRGAWQTRSLFFGIFEDPNDLAQILATSIPLAFGLFRRQNFLTLVISAGLAWLLTAGALATHSRGGYIALISVAGVLVALMLPARWFPTLMAMGLAAALALCPLAAGVLDQSARERVVFWGLANQLFKSNPVFGIGYGMFWQVASDRAAHNAYVSAYTTLGFFGYWFWFGLLQLGVITAWRVRRVFPDPKTAEEAWIRRFAGLCLASITGYCASAYFLSRDFVYPMFFLFALLGGLAVLAERALPAEHPPLIDAHRDVVVYGTLGALASVFYIYFSILLLNKAFGG